MANGVNETHIHEKGDGVYERARDMLEAADIDPEDVHEIEVTVLYGSDGESDDVVSIGSMVSDQPYAEEAKPDPDVEFGPVESDASNNGSGGGGGGKYAGSLPPQEFEGESIRPDSIQGKTLQLLAENPEQWYHRSDLAEDFDGDITIKQASNALSRLFNDNGYVKRREIDPQPDKKGLQREYAITETGRAAIAEGKRRAEGFYEKQEEEMEEAEV